MTESKKTWVTPELIVLVRSRTEEAVLLACKVYEGPGVDPYNLDDCCQNSLTVCFDCSGISSS